MINNCFDKKTVSRAIATRKAEVSVNENPADEVHKTVIKKKSKEEKSARFRDNIWAAD